VANRPPTADIYINPLTALTGETISFDAACDDPDGTIDFFEWDFDGDGIYEFYSAFSPFTTHQYPDDGVYQVVLKVVDDDGEVTAAAVNVTVQNRLPSVAADRANRTATTIDPITFTASAEDQDGFIAQYRWDFDGDGVADFTSSHSGDTEHVYPTAGTYTAVFTAVDDDGGMTSEEIEVHVTTNIPPVAVLGADLEARTDEDVFFDGSMSSDGDGHPLTYHWDFDGDGDWELTSSEATAAHVYTMAGDFTVTLMVSDGGAEGEDSLQAGIIDMHLWAVVVGISDYPGSGSDLVYADDDAEDWYNILTSMDYTVHKLTNSQATIANIRAEIQWLVTSAGPHDKVFFAYSGHGLNYNDAGMGGTGSLIAAYDGNMADTAIANAFLGLETSDACFVFDCCRSGDYDELGTYGGIVLEGCRVNEFTYETPQLGNGVFTYYLQEALTTHKNDADTSDDGQVSAEEALAYAYPRCSTGPASFHPESVDTNGGEFFFE
jgi:PKD repeat protein